MRFLLEKFLKHKATKNIYQVSPLTDTVAIHEPLARYVIGGKSEKSIKKLYDIKTHNIKPSVFMDNRDDAVHLSVDRVLNFSTTEIHRLGLTFKENFNPTQTYHGYGKVLTESCINAGARVIPDTYENTRPYHANIVYPKNPKLDNMEVVNKILMNTLLILHQQH